MKKHYSSLNTPNAKYMHNISMEKVNRMKKTNYKVIRKKA